MRVHARRQFHSLPASHSRRSVNTCKHGVAILSRARKQAGFSFSILLANRKAEGGHPDLAHAPDAVPHGNSASVSEESRTRSLAAVTRPATFVRNSRKTECGAAEFLTRSRFLCGRTRKEARERYATYCWGRKIHHPTRCQPLVRRLLESAGLRRIPVASCGMMAGIEVELMRSHQGPRS
jgi:hypothetical protein